MQLEKLFDYFRVNNSKQKDKLSQEQTDSINAIINVWTLYGDNDNYKLCYILATAKWETAHTMLPIEEYGWAKKWYAKLINGHRYYGRGFIQLTFLDNYKRIGIFLNIDLVNKPELALDKDIAATVIVRGMINGWFTGKKLKDYINNSSNGFINARRIINGTDKAETIAQLAKDIYKTL